MKHLPTRTKHFSPFRGNAEGREGLKKLLLLFTFAFYLSTFAFAQQYGWKDISANMPGTPNLTDVFFVSDDEGWIVSNYPDPIIYHTTDGGETFEVQTTQYSCNAIYMIDKNEGYAGGDNGRVYRTTDGGKNWIAIGSISVTLTDISFPPNGDTGYCCGFYGNIHAITPSDVTKMTSNINGNLSSISFPVNSEEGWVCGGVVIRHYKNNIWNGDQEYPYGGYNAIYMVDSLNGWVGGDDGIIAHTEDGQNWYEQTNPSQNSIVDIFFLDENNGWAIGTGGKIIYTTNRGANWNVAGAGLTSYTLTGVHFTSPTNGYVVGNGKTLLKYGELTSTGNTIVKTPQLSVFPNPTAEKFKVQSSKFKVENATIELYDFTGKKILEKQIPAGTENVEIDVSTLNSGMYFCKIQFSNKCVTKKIVVKQ